MKTPRSISATVTATLSQDGKHLIISVPVIPTDKMEKTKNGKSFIIAESGTWPNSWATVLVEGQQVGVNVCVLMDNPDHPDNKPVAPVAPVTTAPVTVFTKPGKPSNNGVPRRLQPSGV